MRNIPDFIAKPSDIKNYFGSIENAENFVKRISLGVAQTSEAFYKHLGKKGIERDESVPPMLFFFTIDTSQKYDENIKPHVLPVDIPEYLLRKTSQSEKGLNLYIAGSLSEIYIALNMGATQKVNSESEAPGTLKDTNKVMGMIFHAEANMVKVKRDEEYDKENDLPPSQHPNRQECYIHSVSTTIGEGVISYEIERKEERKTVNIEDPTFSINFSEDSDISIESSDGRFNKLFIKALDVITETEEDFSIDDIINTEGKSNFASVHSSIYRD